MRARYAFVLLLLLLCSCSHQAESSIYSEQTSEALILKAMSDEPLQAADYEQILSQLEGMFGVVCTKAQMAIDNGKATKENIRAYLATDADYVKIQGYAHVLDSVLVRYMKSPECTQEIRQKYSRVLTRASRQGAHVGLY